MFSFSYFRWMNSLKNNWEWRALWFILTHRNHMREMEFAVNNVNGTHTNWLSQWAFILKLYCHCRAQNIISNRNGSFVVISGMNKITMASNLRTRFMQNLGNKLFLFFARTRNRMRNFALNMSKVFLIHIKLNTMGFH